MNKKLILLFLVFYEFCAHDLFAQKNNVDTFNYSVLEDYKNRYKEIESKRKTDSIKRDEIKLQLQKPEANNISKRETLLMQLKTLDESDSLRDIEKIQSIESLKHSSKAFAVRGFFNDTLFLIYSKLGSFSAEERATVIESRIKSLVENVDFDNNSIKEVITENTVDLLCGEIILLSVSENDAIWSNTSKLILAKNYNSIITKSVINYKKETSVSNLVKEIGLATLIIILLSVLIFYINRLFNYTATKISGQEGKKIKGIKIKNYTLFDAKNELNVILKLNTTVKWLMIILSLYLVLPILFGIFPWTKHFASTLFGYILNPVKSVAVSVWNYLPKLITIVVIIVIFRYVLKGFYFLKTEIEKGKLKINGFYPDWANPTYQLIKVIVYAFMAIVIFPYLPGSDSRIFQGVSVFLGVLFTFGSSGSLSNVVAGLVLTYMRLFKIGDCVKIGDVIGDVIEKSILVTRIRTIKNEIISIPNSTVMSSHTINFSSDSLDKGLIMHTTVTIGYDVPWKNMHQALLNAADRTEFLSKEPKPFVLQTSLDDFYVSYEINAHTKEPNKQATIYSFLHANIQDCCNEMGIEILSPHYRAQRDGNMVTIPADYLNKDYESPSFNVKFKKDEK